MVPMRRDTIVILLSALLAGSCARPLPLRIPAYSLASGVPTDRFIAGAGKSEITPALGVPMGGHGPGGRVARGYWMRLYARAFYFQDSRNHRLALVSCDLFALPAGLRAEVLRLVNEKRLRLGRAKRSQE